MDNSVFTNQALRLGRLIKHNKMRRLSIISKSNLSKTMKRKFNLDYLDLKHVMEEVFELTLPPKTEYACADRFHDTTITNVLYGKCTFQNCTCDNYDTCYDTCDDSFGTIGKRPVTWKQLESLLFVVEMHKNILDKSEVFSKSVMDMCNAQKIKFLRRPMLGGKCVNQKALLCALSKQRRLQQTMLKAIYSVSSRAKALWAKVRRCVRMHHYAHKLWEYKFAPRVAELDIQSGSMMIESLRNSLRN